METEIDPSSIGFLKSMYRFGLPVVAAVFGSTAAVAVAGAAAPAARDAGVVVDGVVPGAAGVVDVGCEAAVDDGAVVGWVAGVWDCGTSAGGGVAAGAAVVVCGADDCGVRGTMN